MNYIATVRMGTTGSVFVGTAVSIEIAASNAKAAWALAHKTGTPDSILVAIMYPTYVKVAEFDYVTLSMKGQLSIQDMAAA